MKLIEILVKHLNRWPDGVGEIEMHDDGEIFFDGNLAPKNFSIPQCTDGWRRGFSSSFSNAVTREQYEDALAASKEMLVNKPLAWDGQGLPPIGTECEVRAEDFGDWTKIKVAFVHNGEIAAVVSSSNPYLNDKLEKFSAGYNRAEFRPIRTEAERKRDDIAKSINEAADASGTLGYVLYDAIAAGKIPGVKLEAQDA